jgi:hypothetical protein
MLPRELADRVAVARVLSVSGCQVTDYRRSGIVDFGHTIHRLSRHGWYDEANRRELAIDWK